MTLPATFGRIARTKRIDDTLLIETIHAAGLRLPRHNHGHATITLTVAGGYEEIFRARTVAADAGAVILKLAGECHSDSYGSAADTRCIMVEFGPRTSARIGLISGVLDRVWTAGGGPATLIMRELRQELRFMDQASSLIIEGCIWRVLGLAERERSQGHRAGRPHWLAWVEEFIREHADRHLSMEELAAVAGVHPGHLNKVFRRHFRMPVGMYLRWLRVERARRLLLASRDSLAQIATETGFSDQSHLARVFKALTGSTPSRYRRAGCASRSTMR